MSSFVRSLGKAYPGILGAVAVFLAGAGPVAGQAGGTVAGQVTDAGNQQPLANVQVVLAGTGQGALTNQQGEFSITDVPVGEVQVQATLIGYSTARETVTVQEGETITVDLQIRQSALQLDEVVVTGAGVAQERRRLGNTIGTISMDGLAEAPVTNLSQILTGREAGVMGLTSGGMSGEGARIRIRGSASLSQSNEPIVYVDGVRVDNAGGFSPGIGAGGGGTPSRLDDINPDAIDRIEILKGAAAATLYGTEASNGVIQIFTKRGQSGEAQYNLTVEQGFSQMPTSRFEPHASYVMGEQPTGGRDFGTDIGTVGVREMFGIDVEPFEVFETRPFPDLFGTGHNQIYSLSVQGGTDAFTYFVSGRFQKENGPFRLGRFAEPGFRTADDRNQRAQVNANMEMFPLDNLQLRVQSSYTEASHQVPTNNNNTRGVVSLGLLSTPALATPNNRFGSAAFGTVRENMHRTVAQDTERFGLSGTAIYAPLESLAFDATLGVDIVRQRDVENIPFGWNVDNFASGDVEGWRAVGDRRHREVTLDLKGTWTTDFGDDWSSELVTGVQGFLNQTDIQVGQGQEFPGLGIEVVGAGAIQETFESFLEETQVGFMAQQQTGFRDFAFGTVGFRVDEHSAFGETAGAEFYPKASLSVIPSQLQGWNHDRVSTFRVRAAVGTSGLQPGAFDQFTTFSPINAETGSGVAPENLGNPDLQPERALEWEVGTEVGVLDDRVSFEATYWNRTVTDALVARQFAPSGGFRNQQLANLGQIDSEGVELAVNAVAVSRPNFSLNFFADGSFLRERLTDLGDAPDLKVGGTYARYRQFTTEGAHPGAFFGPRMIPDSELAAGEFPIHRGDCNPMTEGELLDVLSQPTNPSDLEPMVVACGTADQELQFLGKPVPDWQGSFGADVTLAGNISIRSLFEYRVGSFRVHDLSGSFRRAHPLLGRNVRGAAELEATMLNPESTAEERLAAADEFTRNYWHLSPYDGLNEIHRADWLRLRELSVTYRVPPSFAQRLGANSLSITAAGRNLGILTKFPGTDPELSAVSRGTGEGGIDENFQEGVVAWGVPIQRQFSIAFRAGF